MLSVSLFSRFNAAVARRDPHGVALRRAARTAIAVPVSIVILTKIPALAETALFGVFAVLALLVFSDFGGTMRNRVVAYLTTIATGIPIMIIGSIAGQTITGAMIVMAIVALLLGVLAVLRGPIASAQTTLLLATVLAVTSSPPDSFVTGAIAWILGGLIATAAAVFLWPVSTSTELRTGLSGVFQQIALVIHQRWAPNASGEDLPKLVRELDDRLRAFHSRYDGNLQRPEGVTEEDRALAELVDIAGRFRTYEHWSADLPHPPDPEGALAHPNHELAREVSDSLAATADLLGGQGGDPGPQQLARARQKHLDQASDWAAKAREHQSPVEVRDRLDDIFPLRLTSASAELAAANALTVCSRSQQAHFDDEIVAYEVDRPRRGAWTRIRSQLSWDSPWFRNALRSAVALSISVGIAKHLGLGHEFWVVLGTLSALRFDALGTGRTVLQAFFGTALGVLLAIPPIVIFGDNPVVWWILLPISLFAAAYTPGTFSLVTGQAGFSFAVLVLFSLIFPARIENAELRILEVSIGLGVSVAIALLMWPRGVTATLYKRMSEAMSAATDHMVASMDYTCGGAIDAPALAGYDRRANDALARAQEAYDLSIAQKPPEAVSMTEWSRIGNAARHVDFAAHIFPGMIEIVRRRGDQRTVPVALVGPMLDASAEVRDDLRASLDVWLAATKATDRKAANKPSGKPEPSPDTSRLDGEGPPSSPAIDRLRVAIANYISEPSDWRGQGSDPRPVLVSWLTDWSAFIEWTSSRLRRDIQGPTATHASSAS